MSLTPSAINSMLGSHSNVFKQTLPFTPTPKIVRKHYSDHDSHYDHHEEHYYSKKGGKRSIAMTALTLLSFLFFLHILQQCLHDQVEMSTTTAATIVMQANIQAKEDAQVLPKEVENRVGEAPSIEPEVTTPFSYATEERKMVTRGVTVGGNFYQYDKIHIPVKMKIIEKTTKVKKL